jgi:colanic acid/amylovoran biosynthesis protein
MLSPPSHILLVGNGSHRNHGCEAIVRGTVPILRREFGSTVSFSSGVYDTPDCIDIQNRKEVEPGLTHFSLCPPSHRWSAIWWETKSNRYLNTSFQGVHRPLVPHLQKAAVALEIGGDNYSLDYGIPQSFLAMDEFLLSHNIPVVLWGASVGPFDADSAFSRVMFQHLRRLSALFVRESESLRYLEENGITHNVHLVADPAFVMPTSDIPLSELQPDLPQDYICLNVSPLFARYFRSSSPISPPASPAAMQRWLAFCVEAVQVIRKTLARPIVLVPHVESVSPENDDVSFMEAVANSAHKAGVRDIVTIGGPFAARTLKTVIANAHLFVGARTHATIAALSSCVPTISLGYSTKARGINLDIYGHDRYCLSSRTLTITALLDTILEVDHRSSALRATLRERIPLIQERAWSAGPLLRAVLGSSGAYKA